MKAIYLDELVTLLFNVTDGEETYSVVWNKDTHTEGQDNLFGKVTTFVFLFAHSKYPFAGVLSET